MTKTYEMFGYLHTEMIVKTENISRVLAELESNKDVFGITIHYVNSETIFIRFGSNKH